MAIIPRRCMAANDTSIVCVTCVVAVAVNETLMAWRIINVCGGQ